jgi:hypothetical protein
MEPFTVPDVIDHDESPVHNWRVSQLKRLGIPGLLAETYADRIDWHQVARRPPGQVPQQRRLAHPRLAVHHQRPALTRAHSVQEPVKHAALGTAVRQFGRAIPRRETCGHLYGTNAIPRPPPARWYAAAGGLTTARPLPDTGMIGMAIRCASRVAADFGDSAGSRPGTG